LGIVTTLALALVYILSLAGIAAPATWLVLASSPVLALTALAYIVRFAAAGEEEVALRWWMPVVWAALVINGAIVWSLGARATAGGHVEYRGGQALLVAHGRVIRTLDPAGVRAVAVWDTRSVSSHMLTLFAFASLGLLAIAPAPSAKPSDAPAS
jgi:hypothetical protein